MQLATDKPSGWWQQCHDDDLLKGVHRHGYGNYQQIKDDWRLSWFEVDSAWPAPEKLTVRFKKLVYLEPEEVPVFSSGLSSNLKTEVVMHLTDYGLPKNCAQLMDALT